jgi:hypothetical protein
MAAGPRQRTGRPVSRGSAPGQRFILTPQPASAMPAAAHMGGPPLPTPPRDFSIREPDILDESMTRGDLVFMLENLHFGRDDLGRLQIDRGVRDFLVRSIAPSRR